MRFFPRALAAAVLTLTFAGSATSAFAGEAAIRWLRDESNTGKVSVQLSGLPAGLLDDWSKSNPSLADWQAFFPVYLAGPRSAEISPMFGTYTVRQNVVQFEPGFALEKGVAYQAIFHPERLPGRPLPETQLVVAEFKIARSRASSTVVSQIYPTASVVPENLLKFYIHFSAPMSRGGIYSHIHLRNEFHKEVELPFLEIGEELWDPSMTRVTLFIDPGRIKRGVRPLIEMGPVLESGKSYSLTIDRDWKDAEGNSLKKGFTKNFRAGSSDREIPDPEKWKIVPPKPNTIGPLTVLFPKPMEHALALRMIQVYTESGASIPGSAALDEGERRWIFTPRQRWSRQSGKLVVVTMMEDLAGNSIAKLFDVDVFEPQIKTSDPTITLPFEVR